MKARSQGSGYDAHRSHQGDGSSAAYCDRFKCHLGTLWRSQELDNYPARTYTSEQAIARYIPFTTAASMSAPSRVFRFGDMASRKHAPLHQLIEESSGSEWFT
jgi:hypothetical protein